MYIETGGKVFQISTVDASCAGDTPPSLWHQSRGSYFCQRPIYFILEPQRRADIGSLGTGCRVSELKLLTARHGGTSSPPVTVHQALQTSAHACACTTDDFLEVASVLHNHSRGPIGRRRACLLLSSSHLPLGVAASHASSSSPPPPPSSNHDGLCHCRAKSISFAIQGVASVSPEASSLAPR
jgi:hypothetical protein